MLPEAQRVFPLTPPSLACVSFSQPTKERRNLPDYKAMAKRLHAERYGKDGEGNPAAVPLSFLCYPIRDGGVVKDERVQASSSSSRVFSPPFVGDGAAFGAVAFGECEVNHTRARRRTTRRASRS